VAFTAWVDRYAAGSDVTITGSSDATVGMAVCRSGAASGWHCGTVTATNTTVCYLDGCVSQMIRTDLCAAPGDSGGSLVTNPSGSSSGREVHAVGLTSGGTGDCTSGGTSYFQPISEALAAGTATLITDS
jgi:streptogrisin C